jgi:hypothetical protein
MTQDAEKEKRNRRVLLIALFVILLVLLFAGVAFARRRDEESGAVDAKAFGPNVVFPNVQPVTEIVSGEERRLVFDTAPVGATVLLDPPGDVEVLEVMVQGTVDNSTAQLRRSGVAVSPVWLVNARESVRDSGFVAQSGETVSIDVGGAGVKVQLRWRPKIKE